jgi:hypothetical protein
MPFSYYLFGSYVNSKDLIPMMTPMIDLDDRNALAERSCGDCEATPCSCFQGDDVSPFRSSFDRNL